MRDTLTWWAPLLCRNGKQSGYDHWLIEQRKYVQKKFASWNNYLKNIVNAIIKCALSKEILITDIISNKEKDKIPLIFINIDYPGEKGGHLYTEKVL